MERGVSGFAFSSFGSRSTDINNPASVHKEETSGIELDTVDLHELPGFDLQGYEDTISHEVNQDAYVDVLSELQIDPQSIQFSVQHTFNFISNDRL
jgi:hypothetical protein